jgi:guanylate kinase
MKGHLFVFSGPSGAGKGSVLTKVLASIGNLEYSVSCTTRKPRPGDINGREYWFMDEKKFRSLVAEGRFLEWAEVHGGLYGTRRDIVEDALAGGKDIILEIDVQGALQVKKKMPEAITVFLEPPSMAELEKRLRNRSTENEKQIQLRLANAEKEMSCAHEYDHRIINDEVDRAAEDFIKIIESYRRGSR